MGGKQAGWSLPQFVLCSVLVSLSWYLLLGCKGFCFFLLTPWSVHNSFSAMAVWKENLVLLRAGLVRIGCVRLFLLLAFPLIDISCMRLLKTALSRWASLIEGEFSLTFAPCHLLVLLGFQCVKLFKGRYSLQRQSFTVQLCWRERLLRCEARGPDPCA